MYTTADAITDLEDMGVGPADRKRSILALRILFPYRTPITRVAEFVDLLPTQQILTNGGTYSGDRSERAWQAVHRIMCLLELDNYDYAMLAAGRHKLEAATIPEITPEEIAARTERDLAPPPGILAARLEREVWEATRLPGDPDELEVVVELEPVEPVAANAETADKRRPRGRWWRRLRDLIVGRIDIGTELAA